ncbi:MAG: TIGR03943 family protein [Spirirestis rafaelensis WJT71-NPBG6]|jgi:uncharacterized repeat protein (TIGR03943 family)|nr:TIGR03943 family protein [Spirirestis rafaelensis WJT71-NPBG6]
MTTQNRKPRKPNLLLPWLDVIAIAAWGVLLLKYWLTGKLNLLIHPNYFGLAIASGISLLIVAFFRTQELWRRRRRDIVANAEHINFFPPGWGSALLLTAAILGLIFTPRVFASDKALQRDVGDLLGTARIKPQQFRASTPPEKRSLVDWVRELNVYPEPDRYSGQKAKVQGFVIHPPNLQKDYFFLGKFVLTCCAADAYPVGLPVKLAPNSEQYTADTWLEVEGQMATEILSGKRQLTITASSIKKIPQPKDPYSY